jgi:hypothetical protein
MFGRGAAHATISTIASFVKQEVERAGPRVRFGRRADRNGVLGSELAGVRLSTAEGPPTSL